MFRRGLQASKIPTVVFFVLGLGSYALAVEGPAPPTDMRCEYLSDPMGIDVRELRFSWVLHHTARAQAQTAYQILVSSTTERLNTDAGDV